MSIIKILNNIWNILLTLSMSVVMKAWFPTNKKIYEIELYKQEYNFELLKR